MDVLYSSSDSYAFLTGISITSLLENNKSCDEINIYIMDNNIKKENKEKLISTTNKYGRNIKFVKMPDMKKMTGIEIETKRWNISTFGRLYMAKSLPDTVHKIINIDCDTIVVGSIEDLWEIDVSNIVLGGVLECINDRYRRNICINNDDYYINAGMIYLNLEQIRKNDFETKFTNYIQQNGGKLAYLDQDVLNSIIPNEMKLSLPIHYNMLSIYFYTTYKQLLKIRRSTNFYTKKEFDKAKNKPTIIHFTTCFLDGLRPWIKGNKHPFLKDFLYYKSISHWSDQELLNDKRSYFIRIRSIIIRKTPRFLLCPIASILHGIIIPNRNRKKTQVIK